MDLLDFIWWLGTAVLIVTQIVIWYLQWVEYKKRKKHDQAH